MATFYCKSVASSGELIYSSIDAADQRDAIEQIRVSGRIPISADPQPTGLIWQVREWLRPAAKELQLGPKLESFALQMASLLEAGIAVDEALQIIQRTGEEEALSEFAAAVEAGVREGREIAQVAAESCADFPRIGISILGTSEASGDLAAGFESLADYLARARKSRERLKSAMVYPIILASVSALSLIAIFTFVIPQFSQLFADMGDALPLSTRFVLGTATFFSDWGIALILIAVIGIYVVRRLLKDEAVQYKIHKRVLRTSAFGDLALKYQTERYCRSLAALLTSGTTLIAAMAIARNALTNRFLAESAESAESLVAEGVGIATALDRSGAWPSLAIQLLQVGERTGDLTRMLVRLSDTFEAEVTAATDRLLLILEPLLVVILGVVIAVIIISVLMGIMSVNDLPL